MKIEASQKATDIWLAKSRLSSIGKKIAWKIFIKSILKVLLPILTILIPIVIALITGLFWFLLVIPILIYLWHKFCRVEVLFDPNQECPICQHKLMLEERKEDETMNFYLRCNECDIEVEVYSIPPDYSGGEG